MRGVMFLRHTKRKKDGKEHRYWSIVENRRLGGGRVVQRPVLYLGEINDSQELAWRKSIAAQEDGAAAARTRQLMAGPVAFETGPSGLGFLENHSESGGFWAPALANMPPPLSRRNFALYKHCLGQHSSLNMAFDC